MLINKGTQYERRVACIRQGDNYTLRHLAVHLWAAGQQEKLHQLLVDDKAWMEVKFERFAGYSAFLEDVKLAISDFIDPLSGFELLTLIQLYTARQMAVARVSSYTDIDLKTLILLGRKGEAVNHARLRLEQKERFEGLMIVQQVLTEGVDRDEMRIDTDLLDECYELALMISDAKDKASALHKLVDARASAGQFERAQDVAQDIFDARSRAAALSTLAGELAQNRQFERADEVAKSIGDDAYRLMALSRLAGELASAGQNEASQQVFQQARELAHANTGQEVFGLRCFARELAKAGQTEEAQQIFQQACEVIDGLRSPWVRPAILTSIITDLAQAGQLKQAYELAETLTEDFDRVGALGKLARELAKAGQTEEAQQIFQQAREVLFNMAEGRLYENDLGRKQFALWGLAGELARAGEFKPSIEMAQTIKYDKLRGDALSILAGELARAGQTEEAQQIFQQAREVTQGNIDTLNRVFAMSALAGELARAGQTEEAQQIFQQTRELAENITGWKREAALSELGRKLVQARQFEQAHQVAQIITFDWSRGPVLSEVTTELARTGSFVEAYKVAQNIETPWDQAAALRVLARELARVGQTEEAHQILQQACDVVLRSASSDNQSSMRELSEMVGELARIRQFKQARDLVHIITTRRWQVAALGLLASAFAQSGQKGSAQITFDKAEKLAQSIGDTKEQVDALNGLASELAKLQRFEEAFAVLRQVEKLAQSIGDTKEQVDALNGLASELAKLQRFEEAFANLRVLDLDEYLAKLIKWGNTFDDVEAGLTLSVLREVTRILGWQRTDYRGLLKLLLWGSVG